MTQAQLALPGLAPPDALTVARAEYARLYAEWLAVAHLAESDERSRLQPLVGKAFVLVDRLENGPAWWH